MLVNQLLRSLAAGTSSSYTKLKQLFLSHRTFTSWWKEGGLTRDLLVTGTLCQAVSLLGTSFVEEEHQSFYFLHTTFLVCLLIVTIILLLNNFFTGSASTERMDSSTGLDDYPAKHQFDSVLMRRNEELRRNMTHAYRQFGLTSQLTGDVNEYIDKADDNLNDVLAKSETYNKIKTNITLLHKLSLTLLCLILSISLFRLSRVWNATGDKWRHLPDLEDTIRRQSLYIRKSLVGTGIAILIGVIRVCPFFTIVTLFFIFGRHFPLILSSTGNLETGCAYGFILLVLWYGCLHNLFLSFSLKRAKNRRNFFTLVSLRLCGVLPYTSWRSKRTFGVDDALLPSGSGALIAKTTKEREKIINKLRSRHHLMADFLTYFYGAFALLWILLQRQDSLLQGALLLLQCELVISAIVWLSQCNVAGITDGVVGSSHKYSSGMNSILALAVMWMAQAFYFAQGNSNSLSTIDVSRGFVGQVDYHPFIHGVLIYIHTMGAPLLVYLRYIRALLANCKDHNGLYYMENGSRWSKILGYGWYGAIYPTLIIWWSVRLSTVGLYAINLVLQRNHLFIWSVFTPKMIYELAQLLNLVIVNGLVMIAAIIFA